MRTLGQTCSMGATFIAVTSLRRQPRRCLPGGRKDGREIPIVSYFPIDQQFPEQERICSARSDYLQTTEMGWRTEWWTLSRR